MTPTHAISADEARRLLAEDRAQFEWRLRHGSNVVWKTKEELLSLFKDGFSTAFPPFRPERVRP